MELLSSVPFLQAALVVVLIAALLYGILVTANRDDWDDEPDSEERFSLPFPISELQLGPSLLKRGFGHDDDDPATVT